jgi:hypothetical protein
MVKKRTLGKECGGEKIVFFWELKVQFHMKIVGTTTY